MTRGPEHELAEDALPKLLKATSGHGEIVGAALIEMLATLADISLDPPRVREVFLQTMKERFAWYDDGGRA